MWLNQLISAREGSDRKVRVSEGVGCGGVGGAGGGEEVRRGRETR